MFDLSTRLRQASLSVVIFPPGVLKSVLTRLRGTLPALAGMFALCAFLGQTGRALALDAASMEAAAKYSAARRGAALLIVQDGKTIFES